MELISVIAAALASYAFGAAWYMALAKPWLAAAGIETGPDGRPTNASSPVPYIVAAICALVIAGMMRHVFALSSIDSPGKGLAAGLGLGLFIATPWIATNYTFLGRSRTLLLIDGGYATIGCTIMGLVLTLLRP